jgi:hypothetical protein
MSAINREITDAKAESFTFRNQKTMYGGKKTAKGDAIFVFARIPGTSLKARRLSRGCSRCTSCEGDLSRNRNR